MLHIKTFKMINVWKIFYILLNTVLQTDIFKIRQTFLVDFFSSTLNFNFRNVCVCVKFGCFGIKNLTNKPVAWQHLLNWNERLFIITHVLFSIENIRILSQFVDYSNIISYAVTVHINQSSKIQRPNSVDAFTFAFTKSNIQPKLRENRSAVSFV